MNVIYIGIAAFGGGIAAALLGWLESQEPFEPKKFSASILRALLAAAIFSIGYTYTNGITPIAIIAAFCAGAGVDALGNRVSGSITSTIKNILTKGKSE